MIIVGLHLGTVKKVILYEKKTMFIDVIFDLSFLGWPKIKK